MVTEKWRVSEENKEACVSMALWLKMKAAWRIENEMVMAEISNEKRENQK